MEAIQGDLAHSELLKEVQAFYLHGEGLDEWTLDLG